jgi:DNA-directed RNA polymerase subunit L
MEINIIKDEKNELEIKINNQTLVEIIRVYLNKDDSVKMVGWKKEHYSKPFTLRIETSGKTAKKALSDAISRLHKDLDKYSDEFKKAVK